MAAVVWVVSSPLTSHIGGCLYVALWIFFCVLFTVEIDLFFFLFVFVVGIPIWHFTYPAQLLSYTMFLAKQIQHFPNLLSFSIFFSSSPVLSRSTKTTIFIKLFFIFCFLLFSCCCVFVFASHERKKNVTIALLEQHTFTLLLLFDL